MGQVASVSVLVVDDNMAIHQSISATLVHAGMTVVAVSSAEEALSRLADQRFDALVSDIWLPQRGGIDLIKLVRQSHTTVRVYAMTGGGPGMSMESASALAVLWGADHVFLKPFDEMELVRMLQNA